MNSPSFILVRIAFYTNTLTASWQEPGSGSHPSRSLGDQSLDGALIKINNSNAAPLKFTISSSIWTPKYGMPSMGGLDVRDVHRHVSLRSLQVAVAEHSL